ncbi:MAG: zinc-finger domain-containing protein [Alphaproteobacteria bacterium]|nr:zinc-finger domain-containing protein [Alphaproteobacteria bacterium]
MSQEKKPIFTAQEHVSCTGTGKDNLLAHPLVYFAIKKWEPTPCPYCKQLYQRL